MPRSASAGITKRNQPGVTMEGLEGPEASTPLGMPHAPGSMPNATYPMPRPDDRRPMNHTQCSMLDAPQRLEASRPKSPRSLGASKPRDLRGMMPRSLETSEAISLEASGPQRHDASKPRDLRGYKPRSLEASEARCLEAR